MPRLSALPRPLPLTQHDAAAKADGAPYAHAGEEPSLDDLLEDPIMHLVLARDGLDGAEVRARMVAAAHDLRKTRSLQRNEGPERK